LESIVKVLDKTTVKTEIIIIDNASSDESPKMIASFKNKLHSKNIEVVTVFNKENLGYPKGNNQGIKMAKGTFILLLNSDVIIESVNFERLIEYMKEHEDVGVLTIQLDLPKGGIDPASHRGFPTAWNAFCYFTKLEKLLGKRPLIGKYFGGYHLTHKDLRSIHDIDAPAGAFFLTRKTILRKVEGFDESFFMYGEDLDLAYRIKDLGCRIVYYPLYAAIHMKRASGLKGTNETVRKKTRIHFYNAMKIFYTKHYQKKYPSILRSLIFFFIDLKAKMS
jgi:GT2 family glycosyltransferase